MLVNEGFNDRYGERPLKRILTKLIENPISEKILSKELKENDSINIKNVSGSLKIEIK